MHQGSFPADADAPAPAGNPPSIRAASLARILRTAAACGWRSANLRPTGNMAGDADGFPGLVLVHGGAGRIWFVLTRQGTGLLPDEAQMWGESLIRAGGVWRVVVLPADVDQLCTDLADAVRPT